MTAPAAGAVDTSHTYEINLQAKFYEFKRPRAPVAAPATHASHPVDGDIDGDVDPDAAAAAAEALAKRQVQIPSTLNL